MYEIGFSPGALSRFNQRFWKFQKIPENCQVSEMQTIQLKIPEILGGKLNGMEISGQKFVKFAYSSQGCPLSANSERHCDIRH